MMGPTHATSGALAGVCTAIALSATGTVDITAGDAIVMSGITAGAGILPDIDHPSATVARSFGPVSQWISKATNKISSTIMKLTRGPWDEKNPGGHRGFTHTLLGVFFLAAVVWLLTSSFPEYKWVTLTVFFVMASFAMNSLFPERAEKWGSIISSIVVGVVTIMSAALFPLMLTPSILALCVLVGGVVHILGDMPTHSGVPNPLAPLIKIKRKRWWKFRPLPKFLRFSASGPMDGFFLVTFSIATVVLLGYAIISPETVGAAWDPLFSISASA